MPADFELIERDGMGRICTLRTPHGTVETPTVLPVINPNRNLITAREMRDDFGAQMVITNSYIIAREPELRETALSSGVHGLLHFDGPVMTDSGTFQGHVYGDLGIDADEIMELQRAFGSDVSTVLDVFSEPEFSRERAAEAVKITTERASRSLMLDGGKSIIACTVQGSLYADLREHAAKELSALGAGYAAVGGIVPLMERGMYTDLVNVVIASKKGLHPSLPVHLFGAGHPLIFPIAALMGCDIFDSASYAKYAQDDRMIFPDRTVHLSELEYNPCVCPVCSTHTLKEIKAAEGPGRVDILARHNLHIIFSEIRLVKQAIREQRLWELAENRARSNPSLFDSYLSLLDQYAFLERYEPLSRESGMSAVDSVSLSRPSAVRFASRLNELRAGEGRRLLLLKGTKPYFSHLDFSMKSEDEDIVVETPFGLMPVTLTETYPFAQSSFSVGSSPEQHMLEYMSRFQYSHFRSAEGKWRRRGNTVPDSAYFGLIRKVCEYQFGTGCSDALLSGKIEFVRSSNTGKLRSVIRNGRQILFFRTGDGLFSLKIEGAKIIHSRTQAPGMRVICTEDAAGFVSAGKSLFCKFVKEADADIRPGDECIVVDEKDRLLACGRTMMNREEMLSFRRGVAVDVRDYPSSA